MKLKDFDMLQVLWVEDDPQVLETFPLQAEGYDIELVSFSCWDEAKEALVNDFDRWSAIVLDAKCKYHKDSTDNAIVFLREALKDISVITKEKDRLLPWYILSGGAETEISDSINDERLRWDADWKHKKFYSKNTDAEILYQRIKIHAKKSPRLQINTIYRDVFEAMEECGIDDEGYNSLEDLLIPIHFPDIIGSNDYNDKFVKAREILEYIFRSMSVRGLLPDWGNKVNLVWSSCILSGIPATNSQGHTVYKSTKRILPDAMVKIMKTIVNVVPPFCHSDGEEGVRRKEYIDSVKSSTYLLKSIALQLCDLVLFYRNHLRDHPDKEVNATAWDKV